MTICRWSPVMLHDARAELAEGPVWLEQHQRLAWTDFFARRIHLVDLDSGDARIVDVGRRVGSMAPTVDGALIVAAESGFACLSLAGELTDLARVETRSDMFMNDGKCDSAGRFWAGSVHTDLVPGAGTLYCLDGAGTPHARLRGSAISNGLGWSPDGRTMYYIDSSLQRVDAFAFDTATGRISGRRPVIEIPHADGSPDGMAVDSDGCLWVALWGAGMVRRYRPDGRCDATLRLPVSQVTSCAFAGPRLDVLVVTTAWATLNADQRAAEPHAGSVFCCHVGASGLPVHTYAAAP